MKGTLLLLQIGDDGITRIFAVGDGKEICKMLVQAGKETEIIATAIVAAACVLSKPIGEFVISGGADEG
jgi:hypothetical protein